jgi:hypothetical protein
MTQNERIYVPAAAKSGGAMPEKDEKEEFQPLPAIRSPPQARESPKITLSVRVARSSAPIREKFCKTFTKTF